MTVYTTTSDILSQATKMSSMTDDEIRIEANGDAESELWLHFERDFWIDFNKSLVEELCSISLKP